LALRSSDIISFTAAISACEGGQWQEALGLLKEMEEMKMTPELMSFLS
jgi:pentatricopeptide repeat protein